MPQLPTATDGDQKAGPKRACESARYDIGDRAGSARLDKPEPNLNVQDSLGPPPGHYGGTIPTLEKGLATLRRRRTPT